MVEEIAFVKSHLFLLSTVLRALQSLKYRRHVWFWRNWTSRHLDCIQSLLLLAHQHASLPIIKQNSQATTLIKYSLLFQCLQIVDFQSVDVHVTGQMAMDVNIGSRVVCWMRSMLHCWTALAHISCEHFVKRPTVIAMHVYNSVQNLRLDFRIAIRAKMVENEVQFCNEMRNAERERLHSLLVRRQAEGGRGWFGRTDFSFSKN